MHLKHLFLIFVIGFLLANSVSAAGEPCILESTPDKTKVTGLLSAPDFIGIKVNVGGKAICVKNDRAAFVSYKLPTYDDLKSIYFDQSKASKVQLADWWTVPITGETVYYRAANLEVNSSRPVSGSGIGVFFVGGNLFIKTNITFGSPTEGVVFVVKGNVDIDKNVDRIDAVIIAEGIICSAFDGSTCPSSNITAPRLLVNGSLVSLNSSQSIKFRRQLTDNFQPAEKIVHQPKYLVILKDLFSDTLQKWSEIQ